MFIAQPGDGIFFAGEDFLVDRHFYFQLQTDPIPLISIENDSVPDVDWIEASKSFNTFFQMIQIIFLFFIETA